MVKHLNPDDRPNKKGIADIKREQAKAIEAAKAALSPAIDQKKDKP